MLHAHGFGEITTELRPAQEAGEFYYAEDYHQQYLHKNPGGYCNHGPNGMTCPVGLVPQNELPSQTSVLPPHRRLTCCSAGLSRRQVDPVRADRPGSRGAPGQARPGCRAATPTAPPVRRA